ncbi:MAG: PAS domain S-box-containing protein [Lentimonas sp.]|jgi:PAS domain S-box-containing protein
MSYTKKIIVSIGLTVPQIEAIDLGINSGDTRIYQIFAEPDLTSARKKSLANLAVECVIIKINSTEQIQAVHDLHLQYNQIPLLGWMDAFNLELYLECIQAGMQDALDPKVLEAGDAHKKIAASIARCTCQQSENTDRNYLNQLLANTTDTIYFKDTDGRFMRISQSLVELFGCSSDKEVLGKTDFDYQADVHARKAYRDEQAVMRSQEDIIGRIEHQILSDGSQSWVSTSRIALLNESGEPIGTMGISRDVTAIHEGEAAINYEKDLLNTIINAVQAGIFVKDKDGRYLLSNDWHANSIGADSPTDVIGKNTADFSTQDYNTSAKKQVLEMMNSSRRETITEQLQYELNNGERKWFRCTKQIINIGTEQSEAVLGIIYPLNPNEIDQLGLNA